MRFASVLVGRREPCSRALRNLSNEGHCGCANNSECNPNHTGILSTERAKL